MVIDMKFNEKQIEFMQKIGLSIDFSKDISDSECLVVEEKVSTYLQKHGFDIYYNPTDEGKICESILDMI